MADTIAITAGSGTSVATDDCGADGHAQRVKLSYSADGVATAITADADGLLVNLGTNNDVTVTNATAANCKVEATIASAQTLATVTTVGTVTTITNVVHVDDNSSSITVDNAGTFAVQAAQSGTWTVQPGNTANTTAWLMTLTALTTYTLISAASNNAQSVKGSAGTLYSVDVYNNGAAARYLKFYNKASSPSPGSDTAVKTIMVPAAGGVSLTYERGLAFSTGIAIACVAGIGTTNNTSISADEVAINLGYI